MVQRRADRVIAACCVCVRFFLDGCSSVDLERSISVTRKRPGTEFDRQQDGQSALRGSNSRKDGVLMEPLLLPCPRCHQSVPDGTRTITNPPGTPKQVRYASAHVAASNPEKCACRPAAPA